MSISVEERDNSDHSYREYKVNEVIWFYFPLKNPDNSKICSLILALISKKFRK